MKKKFLALLLAALMVVSLLPTVAFAANKGTGDGLSEENAWDISAAGDQSVLAWLEKTSEAPTYTLHIAGSGAMKDWGIGDSTVWHGTRNEYKTEITAVDIGSGVTSIGAYAFDECSRLTSVTIPSGVTSIGASAFLKCTGLTSVAIPSSVTSIGNNAFAQCTSVADLYIDSIESWFGITFDGAATCVPFGASAASTRTLHVKNDKGNYDAPKELVISKNIPPYAFYNCSSLESVTIQSGVTTIEKNAFRECENLENVTIPSSVTTINNGVFYRCYKLKSVTIPASVTSIGANVFGECNGLTTLVVRNATSALTTLGTNAFYDVTTVPTIYVPYGKGNAYKEADNWSTYKDNIKEAYMVDVADTANGTVTVDKDCFPTETYTEATETVTVTATPAEGYALTSLKYNDGEDHDITEAKSFTMPTANVTVTAEFEEVSEEPECKLPGFIGWIVNSMLRVVRLIIARITFEKYEPVIIGGAIVKIVWDAFAR